MVIPPVPRTDTSFHTVKGVGKPRRGHTTTVPDAKLAPKPLWQSFPENPCCFPRVSSVCSGPPRTELSGQWRLRTSQKPQGGETV